MIFGLGPYTYFLPYTSLLGWGGLYPRDSSWAWGGSSFWGFGDPLLGMLRNIRNLGNSLFRSGAWRDAADPGAWPVYVLPYYQPATDNASTSEPPPRRRRRRPEDENQATAPRSQQPGTVRSARRSEARATGDEGHVAPVRQGERTSDISALKNMGWDEGQIKAAPILQETIVPQLQKVAHGESTFDALFNMRVQFGKSGKVYIVATPVGGATPSPDDKVALEKAMRKLVKELSGGKQLIVDIIPDVRLQAPDAASGEIDDTKIARHLQDIAGLSTDQYTIRTARDGHAVTLTIRGLTREQYQADHHRSKTTLDRYISRLKRDGIKTVTLDFQ